MAGWCQVQVTTATEEEAQRIATILIDRRLAACVQVVGPIESHYRWEGRREVAREWLCLVKTTQERLDAAVAAVEEAHSYDTPEVVALPITGGSAGYLRWLDDSVP